MEHKKTDWSTIQIANAYDLMSEEKRDWKSDLQILRCLAMYLSELEQGPKFF